MEIVSLLHIPPSAPEGLTLGTQGVCAVGVFPEVSFSEHGL